MSAAGNEESNHINARFAKSAETYNNNSSSTRMRSILSHPQRRRQTESDIDVSQNFNAEISRSDIWLLVHTEEN